MIGEPDLGEQALSKVAEVGISSQLDEVEDLDVDIRTNPLQLMQGKVESVKIAGEGAAPPSVCLFSSITVSPCASKICWPLPFSIALSCTGSAGG